MWTTVVSMLPTISLSNMWMVHTSLLQPKFYLSELVLFEAWRESLLHSFKDHFRANGLKIWNKIRGVLHSALIQDRACAVSLSLPWGCMIVFCHGTKKPVCHFRSLFNFGVSVSSVLTSAAMFRHPRWIISHPWLPASWKQSISLCISSPSSHPALLRLCTGAVLWIS